MEPALGAQRRDQGLPCVLHEGQLHQRAYSSRQRPQHPLLSPRPGSQHPVQGVDEGVHAATRGQVVGARVRVDGRVWAWRPQHHQPLLPGGRHHLPPVDAARRGLRLRRPLLHILPPRGLVRVRGDRCQLRQRPFKTQLLAHQPELQHHV